MTNLLSVVAIILGGLGVVLNPDGLSPLGAVQVSVGIIGGAIGLIWNNFSFAISLFSNMKSNVMSKNDKKESEKVSEPVSDVLLPNKYEFTDNAALIHIRNRLRRAKSVEGLELCSKLATIMFDLEDEVEETDE